LEHRTRAQNARQTGAAGSAERHICARGDRRL